MNFFSKEKKNAKALKYGYCFNFKSAQHGAKKK